jgi:hypothetical protein
VDEDHRTICEPITQDYDGHPDLHFRNGGASGPDAQWIAAASPAAILDILARLKRAEAEQWQPIETAPRDGTAILAWREDCGVLLCRFCDANELRTISDKERDELDEVSLFQCDWWGGDAEGGGYRLEGSEIPTHWQPLPAAPKQVEPS